MGLNKKISTKILNDESLSREERAYIAFLKTEKKNGRMQNDSSK